MYVSKDLARKAKLHSKLPVLKEDLDTESKCRGRTWYFLPSYRKDLNYTERTTEASHHRHLYPNRIRMCISIQTNDIAHTVDYIAGTEKGKSITTICRNTAYRAVL